MQITVHFQAFPSQAILRCISPSDSEHFYFHSLKQALYVLHGKTKPFNDLSIDQQRALWQAICVGDRVGFERVASGFRPSIPVSSPQSLQALRSLPIRIIRRDKPTLQRPVGLWKAATTALDMISPRMENLSMDSKVGAGHETEDGEGEGGGERTVSKASAGSGASTDESLVMKTIEDVIRQDFGTALGVVEDCHSLQILIQGIEVPWEAPIYELWRLMAHCDLFLYIVVL